VTTNSYFPFVKQTLDGVIYGVIGKEISYKEAPMFKTLKEAQSHANKLNVKSIQQK